MLARYSPAFPRAPNVESAGLAILDRLLHHCLSLSPVRAIDGGKSNSNSSFFPSCLRSIEDWASNPIQLGWSTILIMEDRTSFAPE